MPPSPLLAERDRRTGPWTALTGFRAGATVLDLASAEEVDPAVVRRVLRAASIRPVRSPIPATAFATA